MGTPAKAEAERPQAETNSFALRALEAMEQKPLDQWTPVERRLEAHDHKTHMTLEIVNGLETSMPFPGGDFKVVLEQVEVVPFGFEGAQYSTYRLKISRQGQGLPETIPFLDDLGGRSGFLYKRLDRDLHKDGSKRQAKLRTDFSSALEDNQPR